VGLVGERAIPLVWGPSGPAGALHTVGDGGLAALGAVCRRVVGVSLF